MSLMIEDLEDVDVLGVADFLQHLRTNIERIGWHMADIPNIKLKATWI